MLKPGQNMAASAEHAVRFAPRVRHLSPAGLRPAGAVALAGRQEGRDVRFG
jgi:hypothetical protein